MGWSTNVYVTNNSVYTLQLVMKPITGSAYSPWNSGTYAVINTTVAPMSEQVPILGFGRDIGIKDGVTYGMLAQVQFVDQNGNLSSACDLKIRLTGTWDASTAQNAIKSFYAPVYDSLWQSGDIGSAVFAANDGLTNWRTSSSWHLNVGTVFDNLFFTLDSSPRANAASPNIKHVFVMLLENRAFDHLLGFSKITGTDAVTGAPTSINGLTGSESNPFNGQTYRVTKPADYVMPLDPGHEFPDVVTQFCGPGAIYSPGKPYPPCNNTGFVFDYAANGGASNPAEIMKCYDSLIQLPVLSALAQEFAVCDQWHASMPGPTWPNRFFAAAASSGGLDHSPDIPQQAFWYSVEGFSFQRGTIFDKTYGSWRIYRGDETPVYAALHNISITDTTDFAQFGADLQGNYPWAFTFIEPNYGDIVSGSYKGGDSEHPCDDITHGEELIKVVYETLRNSPLWPNSLLIIAWDEHGGFYDHAAPPPAPRPGDMITAPTPPGTEINEYGFDFTQYGSRVAAVVVSAYTPKNVIDHRLYDHSSIPATVEALFVLGPLTHRDALANNVTSLAALPAARTDAPLTLPPPATGVAAAAAGRVPAPMDPAIPLKRGNLAGFLHVAMRADVQLSPPEQREAIEARVRAIKTRGEAAQYIAEVRQKIRAASN
jgi:phospholipase C